MKKAVLLLLMAICIVTATSCEFSFGEKQEPVFQGTANPGVKVERDHNPIKLAELMQEDLSERGWSRKPKVIYESKGSIETAVTSSTLADTFKGLLPEAIVKIPYFKNSQPDTTVTLVFFNMGTPFRAFSVFTRIRQKPMKEYNYSERELILQKNSSTFWEGPFLVQVITTKLGDEAKGILLGVSKGIAYKLYGLIGTYDKPFITSYIPSFQRKDHSLEILENDPFQLTKPNVCIKAVYKLDTGPCTLYVFSDPSAETLATYRRLLITKLLDPASAIFATKADPKKGSTVWINSKEKGIVEISMKSNILAVQTGLGTFQQGITNVPALREIAISGIKHESYINEITLNLYKNIMVVKNEKAKIHNVIMLGLTLDVLSRIRDKKE